MADRPDPLLMFHPRSPQLPVKFLDTTPPGTPNQGVQEPRKLYTVATTLKTRRRRGRGVEGGSLFWHFSFEQEKLRGPGGWAGGGGGGTTEQGGWFGIGTLQKWRTEIKG